MPAVRGGTTNVGTITAVSAVWEPNYGTFWTNCDNCFQAFTLPFTFPFYGTPQTTAFVGTNGYITFGSGDRTYAETIPIFASLPRISAFFDDLYGRGQGGVYVNSTLPGRFVVTHLNVQHFNFGGSNTLQMTLFADGRIQFGYRGITAITTGSIVGITPGPNAQVQQVDYSQNLNFGAPANTSVFEYFLSSNPFDLDNAFIVSRRCRPVATRCRRSCRRRRRRSSSSPMPHSTPARSGPPRRARTRTPKSR